MIEEAGADVLDVSGGLLAIYILRIKVQDSSFHKP
jgi:hypothetical protein